MDWEELLNLIRNEVFTTIPYISDYQVEGQTVKEFYSPPKESKSVLEPIVKRQSRRYKKYK